MGKPEGIFLNLQCDCHRVACCIYIYKTDQSAYQFHHLAARFDSARNKWSLNSQAHIFSILRTGLINKSLQSYQIEENIERYTFGNSNILSCP